MIAPYTSALAEGMPSNWRAPLASYGTEGCFGFYELNLRELIAYSDLDLALQHFKELGNGLVFLNMLEHALSRSSASRFVQVAPLLGLRSGSSSSSSASPLEKAASKVVSALSSGSGVAAVAASELSGTTNFLFLFFSLMFDRIALVCVACCCCRCACCRKHVAFHVQICSRKVQGGQFCFLCLF